MSTPLAMDDEAPAVAPFWRCIPRFLAFPLHPPVMARVTLLPLLSVLPFAIGGSWLFLPLAAGALLGAAALCLGHAAVVLQQSALGRLSPGRYPPDSHVAPRRAGWLAAVLIVLGGAVGLAGWLAGTAGLVVAGAAAMLLAPAGVMALASGGAPARALHPARLARIVTVIGWPYLALCLVPAALAVAMTALYQALSDAWPPALMVFAAQFLAMYALYVMFHMTGYVLYQYRSRLDLPESIPVAGRAPREAAAPRDADPLTDQLGAMIAAGNLEAALEHAYEDQRANPFNIASHERYHRLLAQAGNEERMFAHGRRYLGLLMRQDLLPQALALYEECVRRDPEFRPDEGHEAMSLAEAAARARRPDLALALMRRFDRRYPGHRDIPRAYMLSAELLCERYRDDERAIQILRLLLARYPRHEVAERARRYLATLETLRPGGGQ